MKKYLLLLLLLLLTSCSKVEVNNKHYNIILMIPDGTSSGILDISRDIKGEHLFIDEYIVGDVITYSKTTNIFENTIKIPTDSAASATAYATGKKVYNGNLSIGPLGENYNTILEDAIKHNYFTGLITTVSLIDATPAAFYAHTESRNNRDFIYNSLLKSGIDILIGEVFKENSKYLYNGSEFSSIGYNVVDEDYEDFKNLSTSKFIANFKERYHLTQIKENKPTIIDYTKKVLDIIDDKENFFIMIESGAVDHANHAHDAYNAINDFLAFDNAFKEVVEFAKIRNDTIVIACPDHGNGGITYIENHTSIENNEDNLRNNTKYLYNGHTNENVFLAIYLPSDVKHIIKNSKTIDNTDVYKYMKEVMGI